MSKWIVSTLCLLCLLLGWYLREFPTLVLGHFLGSSTASMFESSPEAAAQYSVVSVRRGRLARHHHRPQNLANSIIVVLLTVRNHGQLLKKLTILTGHHLHGEIIHISRPIELDLNDATYPRLLKCILGGILKARLGCNGAALLAVPCQPPNHQQQTVLVLNVLLLQLLYLVFYVCVLLHLLLHVLLLLCFPLHILWTVLLQPRPSNPRPRDSLCTSHIRSSLLLTGVAPQNESLIFTFE